MRVKAYFTNEGQQLYLNVTTMIPPHTQAFPYWTVKYKLREKEKCDFLHTGVTKRITITGGEEEEDGTVRSD